MPFAASGKEFGREGKSGLFRNPDAWKDDTSFMNVFRNAVDPINPQKPKVVQGTVIYVALEVAVSKLLRRIMSADNKSIAELAVVHPASLGLMGGVGTTLNNPGESVLPYGLKKIMAHVNQGAKGVLAVYLANITTSFSMARHRVFSQ